MDNRMYWFWVILIFAVTAVIFTSCSVEIYEKLGYSESEAEKLHEEDLEIVAGASGQVRTAGIQAGSLIVNALLAAGLAYISRKLNTEKNITKTLIDTIENGADKQLKDEIQMKAITNGVETELNKRVKNNGG